MKIRAGFVSNSSSSSFCIMGIYYGEGWDKQRELEQTLKSSALSVLKGCDAYDESIYVGLRVGAMKEDETLKEFRTRVNKLLEDAGLNPIAGWITDGGRDG